MDLFKFLLEDDTDTYGFSEDLDKNTLNNVVLNPTKKGEKKIFNLDINDDNGDLDSVLDNQVSPSSIAPIDCGLEDYCSFYQNLNPLVLSENNDSPTNTGSQILNDQSKFFMVQEEFCSTEGMHSSTSTASPSHCSDSGVSDTISGVESPRSNIMEDFANENVDSVLTLPSFSEESTGSSAGIEIDDELRAYLLGESEEPTQVEAACSVNEGAINSLTNSNSELTFRHSAAKKFKISNEMDLADYDSDHQSNFSEPKVRKNPLDCFKDPSNFRQDKNIEIVKFLNSSVDVEATADHIMKTVKDRSRKNALQAKLNREKKKAHIQGLERDLESLQKENEALKVGKKQMSHQICRLEDEVHYLKNILANASALSGLLKNISGVNGVKLSTGIATSIVDNNCNRRDICQNLRKAGVCLHVNDGEASIEFCAQCSSQASQSCGKSSNS